MSAYDFLLNHRIDVQPREHLKHPAAPKGRYLESNDMLFRVSYLLHCLPSLPLFGEKSSEELWRGTSSESLALAQLSAGNFLP